MNPLYKVATLGFKGSASEKKHFKPRNRTFASASRRLPLYSASAWRGWTCKTGRDIDQDFLRQPKASRQRRTQASPLSSQSSESGSRRWTSSSPSCWSLVRTKIGLSCCESWSGWSCSCFSHTASGSCTGKSSWRNQSIRPRTPSELF